MSALAAGTTAADRYGPESTGLTRDSKAQAEQVRWVAVERVGPIVGILDPGLTEALDEALRLHLAL
jgi:mRNA interferase MazF